MASYMSDNIATRIPGGIRKNMLHAPHVRMTVVVCARPSKCIPGALRIPHTRYRRRSCLSSFGSGPSLAHPPFHFLCGEPPSSDRSLDCTESFDSFETLEMRLSKGLAYLNQNLLAYVGVEGVVAPYVKKGSDRLLSAAEGLNSTAFCLDLCDPAPPINPSFSRLFSTSLIAGFACEELLKGLREDKRCSGRVRLDIDCDQEVSPCRGARFGSKI